jgi:hypothetical protein
MRIHLLYKSCARGSPEDCSRNDLALSDIINNLCFELHFMSSKKAFISFFPDCMLLTNSDTLLFLLFLEITMLARVTAVPLLFP